MDPERWRKIEDIYNAALELEAERRDAFIDEACAGDASVLLEVRQLLELQSESEDFIESPAIERTAAGITSRPELLRESASMKGRTLGHYRVGEELGRGGMSEVYSAEDLNLSRKVALKFLPEPFAGDTERMARFEREAKLLASLSHPNIAAIYGLEQAEGKRFLVLELVEGVTLEQRLIQGPLPVEDALDICRQIAEGLAAAHEKGVIHRDLKPANVMIMEEDKVKILDFGMAKALSKEDPGVDSSPPSTLPAATPPTVMTQPGVILGTAAYMSPEQAKGKPVDRRTDIWAFGCILYECLTGKRAFERDTVGETLASILRDEPDWQALPEAVPQGIRSMLRRCLEKDPGRRFRHPADVRILIEDVTGFAESTEAVKHSRLAWILASMFLIAALALSFLYFRAKAPVVSEPIRLEIEPPTNLDWGGAFAVSPDRRHLAFSGTGADGKNCVWIRSLGSLEARPVSGSESEHIPSIFWSPDSRFVAWGTGGILKKADISGMPAQSICDIRQYAIGGSWNRDDVIIFGTYGPVGSEGLMRVSAAGGTASALTHLDRSRQEQAHFFPTFLSDGRHFLYWQNSSIPEYRGVYVGSLNPSPGEQSVKPLLRTEFAHVYVPSQGSGPGQILFLREKALMSQLFDEKHLKILGEPIRVTEQVGSFSVYGFFSASTNGVLIYRSGVSKEYCKAMWYDRQGKPLGAAGLPDGNRGLALSPDAMRAAISAPPITQTGTSLAIFLRDFSRGVTTRFTLGSNETRFPVWSPDGSGIIFASIRNGGIFDLYQKPTAGTQDEELLLKTDEDKFPTSWSRDQRFLLYTAVDPETNADIYVLPLEDRKPMPFLRTGANELDARISPNMRWIAYVSDESGRYEVYVQAFAQGSGLPSETGRKLQISGEGGFGPRWGKDGREPYYRTREGKMMIVDVPPGMPLQPGVPRVLFEAPQDPVLSSTQAIPLSAWDVTPDGSRFLLSVMDADAAPAPFRVILNWTALLRK